MSTPPLPKVAGIGPALNGVPQTPAPSGPVSGEPAPGGSPGTARSGVQDRLACWIADLSTLHDLTERLSRTTTLTDALRETLRAGACLLGARRGMIALRPGDGLGPERLVGHGLSHAELGHLETVPPGSASHTRLLDTPAEAGPAPARKPDPGSGPGPDGGQPTEIVHHDIAHDEALDPRHREVAAHLGCAASYAVPLAAPLARLGAAVWLYDRPAAPDTRQRRLLARYLRQAAQHIANRLELSRARAAVRAVRDGLRPARLPLLPGVSLAVRHRGAPRGGGDFYDALALPEGALGLAIGGTSGSGPGALAATGALRAGLRAYAVMEGEDPVAVLSDLELLLRLTEPDRAATVLFGYAEPLPAQDVAHGVRPGPPRRLVLASAGHPPPLIVGTARVEFAETTLSAPLGMLACWEAPSVHVDIAEGETVLLYSAGLLHGTGEPRDAAFARLESAALSATPAVRADPNALADHIVRALIPGGIEAPPPPGGTEDIVLLAARF